MALTHNVSLSLADGADVDVWDGYQITQSMIRHGSPFTFELWRSNTARSTWDYLLDNVKAFDPCTVRIDGAVQMCGQIESVRVGSDRGGAKIIVSGRDTAGCLQSWDLDPRIPLRKTTLEDALRAIFEPFGFKVFIGVDASVVAQSQRAHRAASAKHAPRHPRRAHVDRWRPDIGTKAWQAAQKLCRRAGYMMWVAPWDTDSIAVIVDKPRYDSAPIYQLTRREVSPGLVSQDSNILAGWRTTDVRDVPTEVFVYGQAARGDGTPARTCAHLVNDRLDAQFVRFPVPARPIHARSVSAQELGHNEQQAARLLDDAMVRHRAYEAIVQGHGQTLDGGDDARVLWAINNNVRVRDDVSRIDETMMIDTLEFTGSRNDGKRTKLNLHPLYAIRLQPDPEA